MFRQTAVSQSQNVRIGGPLSHLQHFERFRPSAIGIAKCEQAKVQVVERARPLRLQLSGKRFLEVENGQRLLQVFIGRDELAHMKKSDAERGVAAEEHRRMFNGFGGSQKLVGEFQSVVQLQPPVTY
jgi:hypothetical protein